MSEQTDTDYQQPRHADIPYTVKPSPAATLNGEKPAAGTPARPWPLAARLAVAVLIIGLATLAAGSLISIRAVSVRASQASRLASSEQSSLTTMSRQLAAVQARADAPAPKIRQPTIYSHYGVCLTRTTDNATGDLANIVLEAPVMTGGSYSCPQGNFVSVVPAP